MKERLFILDDLDGHVALLLVIERLDNLPKGALAYEGVNLVPVEKPLPCLDDVVVVLVVVTLKYSFVCLAKRQQAALEGTHVVVELPLLFPGVRGPRLPLGLRLLRPPLLLRVVHLVDVLVRLDEVHRELSKRRRSGIAELGFSATVLVMAPGRRRQAGGVQVRQIGGGRHVNELHGPRGILRVVQQAHGRG